MLRLLVLSLCLLFSFAVTQTTAQESVYERNGIPGEMSESRFVLIAARSPIELHTRPDLRAPERSIPYQPGWRIPFGETLVRTLEVTEASTAKAGTVEVLCERLEPKQLTLDAGEPWTYLQQGYEGRGMARIQGQVCEVPVLSREDVFGAKLKRPLAQWWVQLLYADGTSPGWLLVTPDTVTLRFLRCC